jgi:chitin biosynthesis protein CHS5
MQRESALRVRPGPLRKRRDPLTELAPLQIEFPSILLPPTITSGSIVDIHVSRNTTSEQKAAAAFASLQRNILQTFGTRTPAPPVLRVRNATQTAIVLEWDPLFLATAELRSLSLYRNGAKAGAIPRPLEMRATKISGLVVDKEYTFHLVLRTSAGTSSSERVTVRTHKMTDLSGITVTPGPMPSALRQSLEGSLRRIGAKLAADEVRIDTTHFVCTEGRGPQWEKAVEMNVPVVVPDWVKGCEREGRIVGVRGYYLNADPKLRQVGPGAAAAASPMDREQRDQDSSASASARRSEASTPRPEPDTAEKPPPPPAKDDAPPPAAAADESSDEDDSAAAGQAEPKSTAAGEEQKARREDVKEDAAKKESSEEESEDDDEDDERDDEKGVADSPASAVPVKKDGEGKDDNESFQDVAL